MKLELTRVDVADSKSQPRLRLRVTAAAEASLRRGHPWLFAESIREQNRHGISGELAVVYDRDNKFLAVGLFDPDSAIRVRILHAGRPQTLGAAWWSARFDAAVQRRDGLLDARTTGYRLINGESDGWPGLVLDRYDKTLVLKLYTAAWLPRLEEIVGLIRGQLDPQRIVLRTSRNVGIAAPSDGGMLYVSRAVQRAESEFGGPVVFLESGLRFEADVVRGQKTGVFLDQRENRRLVESLAGGRTVLNGFSFSGGFSLYAARGEAKSVTDLDLSARALAAAERNFKLNETEPRVARCQHELIQADAFDWLAQNASRRFGLIVLDPPSLAKRETERAGAIRAYERLAGHAIKHLLPGGILLACSCSAHVTAEEFFRTVRQSAVNSRRRFVELQTTAHAPDHPATFREAEYLKAIYLKLS